MKKDNNYKTHLVVGDIHTIPGDKNERATLLGKCIADVNPDVFINLGDQADMLSLCSYDKGRAQFIGRSYQKDIEAHLDFQEKIFEPLKKLPKKDIRKVFIIGNHEERINRALSYQPELQGTIGLKDLELENYYDNIIEYSGSTPGTIRINGITYSHYFVSGISGKPSTSGNPASLALSKSLGSITFGHCHLLDFASKPTVNGNRINGLSAGCFVDKDLEWAGTMNSLWWKGLVIKREVNNGNYDAEFVSLKRLANIYGKSNKGN